MDSIIRHVPKGWEEKKIKQCFKFKNGKGFSGELREKADSYYCYPVYGGNGIIGYCNIPLLDKPTIIVGRVGEYCGNVFKTQEKSWVTDNAMLVSEVLLKDFDINFWTVMLNSLHFNHFSDSTGQPKITQGGIGAITVVYPKSATEQTSIANILSKVDEAIASVQNSIAAAERLKKSLMQNLLIGKMKPDGTFRTSKEFYIDEKFGKVPVGWEVKRIDEISERITDVINPTKTKEVYDYIGLEHIVPDKFIRCGKGLSNETVALKVKFEKGDLLYGKLRPYLNKVFISDISGVGSTEFIVLRNNEFTNWIYLNLQLQRFLDYTKSMTAGTQHPRASWKDIKHYLVCIPKNEIERKMIEERLFSLEKYRFSQQELVMTHEHLKKSLMQNLLTGKIRVEHFINN